MSRTDIFDSDNYYLDDGPLADHTVVCFLQSLQIVEVDGDDG